MAIDQPIEERARPRAAWLDRPLLGTITVERAIWLLGALVLVAIVTRFWDLGARALHHDESLHAYYSWLLYDAGNYRHEPLMHGPVLFHLTAFGYWLFGDTDATSRLWPALLGVFLVAAPWAFRDWLGRRGALATSFLILISPTLLYYSRFIRHDIFAATWTLVIIYGLWRYLQRGRLFDLAVMAGGWALLFAQKEVSFLLAVVFWSFLALVLLLRKLGRLGPRVALRDAREFHLLLFMGALLLPFLTALLMHLPLMLNQAFGLALPILDPGAVGGNSETSVYNTPWNWPTAFNIRAYLTMIGLAALGALAAWRFWDVRKFLVGAGVFYAIFLLFQTTFLTNMWGVGSGFIGALGYWLEQHGVERGNQPWFYYLMLLPLYELLPLLVGVVGGIGLLLTRRIERIAPPHEPGDGPNHLNTRALWPWFNLWWFFLTFALLSYAGEKMPWLLVHLALPLAFLAGWVIDRVTRGLSWAVVRQRESLLLMGLFPLFLLSAGLLFALALTGRQPWPINAGNAATIMRWLLAALFLVGSTVALQRLSERVGNGTATRLALLSIIGLMTLMTVRYAVIVTYVHGDIASEPLIYTQSTPSVTQVMAEIDGLSERLTGGKGLAIAYDSSTSWPYSWYLRDYPNAFFFAANPESYTDQIRNATVVLAGNESNDKLLPMVADYNRSDYKMRWWFPEDYRSVRNVTSPDPDNPEGVITTERDAPLPLLRNAISYWKQPTYRRDFIDFLLYRDLAEPLAGEPFYVYTQPDVVSDVWSLGEPVGGVQQAPLQASDQEVTIVGGAETLNAPSDMVRLADGTLAVADTAGHRIQLFDTEGVLTQTIGGFGEAPGQFNEPWGIAAAPDGSLYVADTFNHRIQHLAQDGTVLNVWGRFGETQGTLGDPTVMWGPRDLALDSAGNVYVTDTGNKRILVFAPDGAFVRQFGGGGGTPGQLQEPVGIAAAPGDTFWVADTWNRRLQQFSAEGEAIQQLLVPAWEGTTTTNKPYVAVAESELWVSDPDTNRLIALDEAAQPTEWQNAFDQLNGLSQPRGVLWDADAGQIWVVDSGNNRILAIEP